MNEYFPQRKLLSKSVNRIITALMVTLGIMIIALSVSFIFLVSSSGQKGYELNQLRLENDELQTENEKFKRDLTETMSYQKIENAEKVKGMSQPLSKTFIQGKK